MKNMFNRMNRLSTWFAGSLLCGSLVLAQESANSADKHKAAVPQSDNAGSPSAKAPGVVVFVDPVTHQIRPPERGEVSTLTNTKGAPKPSTKAKIAATSKVIAGPSGSKGVVLGQDMMQFMVVTKDSTGALKEDCVNGSSRANQALTAAPSKPVQTQTPGELDVQ